MSVLHFNRLKKLCKMMSYIVFTILFVISATEGSNLRISGGQTTTIGEFPFAAALLTGQPVGAFVQACGGTILTNSAILSAASCYHTGDIADPPARWRTRIGSAYSGFGGTVHLIRLITRHPDFNHTTLDNDIAVLRTTTLMTLVRGSVEGASIAGINYLLEDRQSVVAIGWGATSIVGTFSNVLRRAQMFTIEQEICAERYAAIGLNVTSSMICAGWLDVGIVGQCSGDTGSPLLHNGVVVGVYSWTEGCGQPRFPNINTRVPPFSRWIVASALA